MPKPVSGNQNQLRHNRIGPKFSIRISTNFSRPLFLCCDQAHVITDLLFLCCSFMLQVSLPCDIYTVAYNRYSTVTMIVLLATVYKCIQMAIKIIRIQYVLVFTKTYTLKIVESITTLHAHRKISA